MSGHFSNVLEIDADSAFQTTNDVPSQVSRDCRGTENYIPRLERLLLPGSWELSKSTSYLIRIMLCCDQTFILYDYA